MKRLLGSALIILGVLAGCGNNSGSEYLGKWVNLKSEKRFLEIERNGDSFMVRNTGPSFIDGKPETKNIPATYANGVLKVSMGMGDITLAIDKASGNLTDGSVEYKKTN
ncbi:hypothetical protein [Cupriavidus sp. D39]|uniref:hypothetical protein n=1 Tax=Cupriavidus sp. D39 TaxID=2997877 RepID=UPI00226D93AA|nr:hypothetical protein [Cupriavidus sp. D39]MCY0853101.1 hypothetical protein [Cupriavidus sp. D39]